MREKILADVLGTSARLRQAVAGLDETALHWKASPDRWSIAEVLGHLTDHSVVVSFRIRAVLAGATETLPALAQDAWVDGQRTNESSAAGILEDFEALLRYNIRLLDRLQPHGWAKSGVNAQGTTVSVADIARGFAAHVERHLGQIDRIRQARAEANGGLRSEVSS